MMIWDLEQGLDWGGNDDVMWPGEKDMLPILEDVKGRRNRVIRLLCNIYPHPDATSKTGWTLYVRSMPVVPNIERRKYTMEEIAAILRKHDLPGMLALREAPSSVTLPGVTYASVEELEREQRNRDSELPICLQDLSNEIVVDVMEACQAFNGDVWYPGVDEGIEPVTDEHIRLVIAAMQRELNRELREVRTHRAGRAVPLNELPFAVQRALVERRRLRFQQWGIGHEQWEKNAWSLWDVPEDPDWEPRWKTKWEGIGASIYT